MAYIINVWPFITFTLIYKETFTFTWSHLKHANLHIYVRDLHIYLISFATCECLSYLSIMWETSTYVWSDLQHANVNHIYTLSEKLLHMYDLICSMWIFIIFTHYVKAVHICLISFAACECSSYLHVYVRNVYVYVMLFATCKCSSSLHIYVRDVHIHMISFPTWECSL